MQNANCLSYIANSLPSRRAQIIAGSHLDVLNLQTRFRASGSFALSQRTTLRIASRGSHVAMP